MCGWGVSYYTLWSIEIAGESRESNQRNVWERKKRLRNRDMTKMSCFKGVVIKNYTENSAKLPGCLNQRGKSTHCANKKINAIFTMHHIIQDPLPQWEKCTILYRERDCLKSERGRGGPQEGAHTGRPRDFREATPLPRISRRYLSLWLDWHYHNIGFVTSQANC